MQFFFESTEIEKISNCINNIVEKNIYRPIVFLCIGTDKIVGDSFGPIVGHFLSNEGNMEVYGDLLNTVNATNLYEVFEKIQAKYNNPFIIVIDSAISEENLKNKIVIGMGGIKPGSALDKDIIKVGDMYINAIVCESGENNFEQLKKVKLYDIFNLSTSVANAIKKIKCLGKQKMVSDYIS